MFKTYRPFSGLVITTATQISIIQFGPVGFVMAFLGSMLFSSVQFRVVTKHPILIER